MKRFEDIKNVMWVKSPFPGMLRKCRYKLSTGVECEIIAGVEGGWDHVSVVLYKRRLPTWTEMCEVKDLFFDPEEDAVQIHPKESEYVDIVDALHLWRPHNGDWSLMNGKGDDNG